ncbi:hypothetical protein GCM10023175_13200 [Pseudonocardia xishanensis]|uniref:Uncharacterized protein n=1 Tax=Pseudonocardia xishanensis TaxID=630995 RepID=A0ABP8RJ94_9PSEU
MDTIETLQGAVRRTRLAREIGERAARSAIEAGEWRMPWPGVLVPARPADDPSVLVGAAVLFAGEGAAFDEALGLADDPGALRARVRQRIGQRTDRRGTRRAALLVELPPVPDRRSGLPEPGAQPPDPRRDRAGALPAPRAREASRVRCSSGWGGCGAL